MAKKVIKLLPEQNEYVISVLEDKMEEVADRFGPESKLASALEDILREFDLAEDDRA